jgi:hypothetical protein
MGSADIFRVNGLQNQCHLSRSGARTRPLDTDKKESFSSFRASNKFGSVRREGLAPSLALKGRNPTLLIKEPLMKAPPPRGDIKGGTTHLALKRQATKRRMNALFHNVTVARDGMPGRHAGCLLGNDGRIGRSGPGQGGSGPRPGPSAPFLGCQDGESVRSGPSMGRSAPLLGRSAPLLGRSAPLLGRSAPLLGRSAPLLGRSAPLLGRSAPLLGRSAPLLGRTAPALGPTGPPLGRSGPLIGRSGPLMGQTPPRRNCGVIP